MLQLPAHPNPRIAQAVHKQGRGKGDNGNCGADKDCRVCPPSACQVDHLVGRVPEVCRTDQRIVAESVAGKDGALSSSSQKAAVFRLPGAKTVVGAGVPPSRLT